MFDPPPPPAGSTIERIDDGDTLFLEWREVKQHPVRKLAFGLAWIYAMGLLFAAWVLFLSGDPQVQGMPIAMKLLFLGLASVMVGAMFLPLLIPRKPESLALHDAVLHHDTGTPPLPWLFALFFGPMAIQFPQFFGTTIAHHWYRRRRMIPREEMGTMRLERVGERQRLTIDHGADRIELGPALREPEREWLSDVLEQWKAASW